MSSHVSSTFGMKSGFDWTFRWEVTNRYVAPTCEMFSKNRHVCSRIAETTNLFQKCRAEKFPIVSVTVLILINCDADRSGAHGTRKVTISSQFVTIDFYVWRNVLAQTMFISRLCYMLKSMPKSTGCTQI